MVFIHIICENQTHCTHIYILGLQSFSCFQRYSSSNEKSINNLCTLLIIPVAEFSTINGIPYVYHEQAISL